MEHRLYTWPHFLEGEAVILNQLFELGLPWLHLRKPNSSLEACQALLENIAEVYHSKIILHQHWALADQFCLGGLHWTESRRAAVSPSVFAVQVATQQAQGYQVGTAIHQPEQLASLPSHLNYATVSPVFKSISKAAYCPPVVWTDSGKQPFLLVALGGIDADKLPILQARGFRSFAVLGAIWQPAEQAVQQYQQLWKTLQQLPDLTP